jgi:YfiR/HmsC-like
LKKISTRLLISLWLILITIPVTGAQNRPDDEHLFKAAYVYNFAKFTDWPETVWKEKNSPLVLCTVGKDELVDGLKWLGGKEVRGRSVVIRLLESTQISETCHVLYIATSESDRYKNILKSVSDNPVLTVSELPQFARSGGIIELYRKKGRTRFIIDLGAARKIGLMLSARLLGMAVVVGDEEQQ